MLELNGLISGIQLLGDWQVILFIIIGVTVGIIVGAIPGLTASTGMALLITLTYTMDPMVALAFLGAVYAGASYGGSITAILLNAPGTPSATVTTFDGYPMTQNGEASRAMGLSIGSSVLGGFFSYGAMLLILFPLAAFALKFGSPELFLLAVFGLTIIASMKGEEGGIGGFSKGIVAGLFGVLLGTVGIATTGTIRGANNLDYLIDGIPIVPVLIGFLAFSEMIYLIEEYTKEKKSPKSNQSMKKVIEGIKEVFKHPITFIRSSLIGLFVGTLPAAGATVASFLSYNESKKYKTKSKVKLGEGAPEGVISAESANNASTGGAMTTMLALGIPGSESTALIMGAMILHGLTPGPQLFTDQLDITYAIIIALLLSQVALLVLAVVYGNYFSKIINIPIQYLVPTVTVFCVVGAFAVRNAWFDILLMFIFGIIGYFMKKNNYPVIGVVLGLVLGPLIDREFITTSIRYSGDYTIFLTRPISLILVIMIVLAITYPYIKTIFRKIFRKKENA